MDSRLPSSREFIIELDSASYLVNNPLSEQEIELYRSQIKKRDSFSKKVFFGVFIFSLVLIEMFFSFTTSEALLSEANGDLMVLKVMFIATLCLIISSSISAIAVGAVCPVNISIDGVSYCSHLSDLDYINFILDYSTLSEESKRFTNNISDLNRPLCSFEVEIIKTSCNAVRDRKI